MDHHQTNQVLTNRQVAIVALVVLVLLWAVVTIPVAAQENASAVVFTLNPGGTARVPVRFWCLDPGKPFPTGLAGPVGTAGSGIIRLLDVAEARNVTVSDTFQVQQALWRLRSGRFTAYPGRDHALAQDLVATASIAQPAPVPVLGSQGVAGLQVTVDNLMAGKEQGPTGMGPYYGSGTLIIHNPTTTNQTFRVTGAVFVPTGGQDAQNVVAQHEAGWPVDVQGGATTTIVLFPLPPTPAPGQSPLAPPTPGETVSPLATPSASATPRVLPAAGGNLAAPYALLIPGALFIIAGLLWRGRRSP
jgi:hypothetical protein